jgi:hypothetical protein
MGQSNQQDYIPLDGRPITDRPHGPTQSGTDFEKKAGEIKAFRALEIGATKWCKEHILLKGNDLTDEGISLSDDMELWWVK